jgi:hypothetical protein
MSLNFKIGDIIFDIEIQDPEYGSITGNPVYELKNGTVDMIEIDWYGNVIIPYTRVELERLLKTNKYYNIEILGELNE